MSPTCAQTRPLLLNILTSQFLSNSQIWKTSAKSKSLRAERLPIDTDLAIMESLSQDGGACLGQEAPPSSPGFSPLNDTGTFALCFTAV